MTRIRSAIILALLLVPRICLADDEEAKARGKEYLETIGHNWSAKLPEDKVTGMFMGRKWIGKATLHVESAPPDSGAVFEVTSHVEWDYRGSRGCVDGRQFLTKDMVLVSAECTGQVPIGISRATVKSQGGHWKAHRELGGRSEDFEGEVGPCLVWDPSTFPRYLAPGGDDVRLDPVSSAREPCFLSRRGKTMHLSVGGTEGDYDLVQQVHGEDEDWLFLAQDGSLALGVSSTFEPRFSFLRDVSPAATGKDIGGAVTVAPPAKAVLAFYRAIKREDMQGIWDVLDIDRMAEERKRPAVEIRQELEQVVSDPDFRNSLPETEILDDVFALQIACWEKGEDAVVRVAGTLLKLSRCREGARNGEWLISGLSQ